VKRARLKVRLLWGDQFGAMNRVLEVSRGCPHCGCTSYRPADTEEPCFDARYAPAECVRCSTLWARERAAPASSAAAVEEAPPRTFRARVKRAWCELVGRRAS
jgi:predicted  nucleic acid-binding Zn-ribbon protein